MIFYKGKAKDFKAALEILKGYGYVLMNKKVIEFIGNSYGGESYGY
jgi:hypothetical protein